MNNKGFAITSIIYGLMLLFVMVVASFISVLVGRNRRMDDLLEGVRESLDYPVIKVEYVDSSNYFKHEIDKNNDGSSDVSETFESQLGGYITAYRGEYDFSSIVGGCKKYLPKNIVVVYADYFDSSVSGLYYNTEGGEFNTTNYIKLCS